ncbi:MAG TPA: SIMPL domain-containing protein [Paracoccaceae bacterium]|nr:SIMPL domain-containing protein [Paracoccaceae bacterium]
MRSLVPALLALTLALPAPALAADGEPATITVSGTGEASAAPDLASISLGVVTTGATAAEALAANSTAMQAVFDLLAAEGIEDRDVQTSRFALSPLWQDAEDDEEGPKITQYQADNLVTVRVREIGRLGGLLDRLAGEGANQINAIAFEISDPKAALEEAERAAIADALARGRLYAEAAGVKLGRVLSLTETGPELVMPQIEFRAAEAAAVEVPIAEGESTVTATVSVTFAIE